jgi:DNA-binding CsgD family transcriptional regulator
VARRYRLELTLAAARAFEGHAHAHQRRRVEMERCFADAEIHGQGDPGIATIIHTGRAIGALAEEDRPEALGQLRECSALSWQAPGDQSTGPSPGIWALVRAVDEPTRTTVLPDAPEWWRPVHFLSHAFGCYAEAVVLGRAGRDRDARAMMAAADAELDGRPWYLHLARRLVAEAALADGWGEPVTWLREALAFFGEGDQHPIASACRSLLRRAGVPVSRRRCGSEDVPADLRSHGITGRELEVLRFLAEGLPNQEIGERLYLSPRTVERHVANIAAKIGVERRAQVVAFAARSGIGAAPPS